MLLAELGADVVRIVRPSHDEASPQGQARTVCLDRGKALLRLGAADGHDGPNAVRLRTLADVLVTDESRGQRVRQPAAPEPDEGLIRVWMPPYGQHKRWADLPDDPLLLAAVSGIAAYHPSAHDVPVAPVVPTTAYIHGALAATAAVAALVERERHERVSSVTVTGLHAAAAQMTTVMVHGLDTEVFRPGTALRSGPNFRLYQAGDGAWFILAALTPELFVLALSALDQLDLLLLPGMDGDPARVVVPAFGAQVGQALERLFDKQPRQHWLELLSGAAIPCAPVATRAEWMHSDLARVNRAFTVTEHTVLGTVRLPDVPVSLSATPGRSRSLPTEVREDAAALWSDAQRERFPAARPGDAPLGGIRVLDMATFLAAPFGGSILAGHGAEVIKLESPSGDPYRSYPISFLATNQRKRTLALDLKDPDGMAAFLRFLPSCDALIENLRPGLLERLGMPASRLRSVRPDLIHCSVSAYGHVGPLAGAPGFDPIFQALSGLAIAQGGAGEPVTTTMAPHDTAAGSLAALGIVTSLFVRQRRGIGQEVRTSLALASSFLQSVELTTFKGRAPTAEGGPDFPGPSPRNRFYRCEDGWIAVAATGPGGTTALREALGLPAAGPAEDDRADLDATPLEEALAARTVAGALATLRHHEIAACPVLDRSRGLDEEFLEAEQFSHVLTDPQFGRVKVARGYADWTPAAPLSPAGSFRVGEHTSELLLQTSGHLADPV